MENESCCNDTVKECCGTTHWSPDTCCAEIQEMQCKIKTFLPDTRQRSILLTKLDDAFMWAYGAFKNGN